MPISTNTIICIFLYIYLYILIKHAQVRRFPTNNSKSLTVKSTLSLLESCVVQALVFVAYVCYSQWSLCHAGRIKVCVKTRFEGVEYVVDGANVQVRKRVQ
jgi:hypothetical protein